MVKKLNFTELKAKDIETLEADLVGLRETLMKERIRIQIKGDNTFLRGVAQSKRNIARVLTCIAQKKREALQKRIIDEKWKLEQIPKRLRPKMTHKLRLRLTHKQEKKVIPKVARIRAQRKLRNYAVLA